MSETLATVVFLGSLVAALAMVHRPLGDYLARVLTGRRHLRVERVVYRLGGIDGDAEQTWSRYLRSVLAFSAVSVVFLYVFLRVQHGRRLAERAAHVRFERVTEPTVGVAVTQQRGEHRFFGRPVQQYGAAVPVQQPGVGQQELLRGREVHRHGDPAYGARAIGISGP